MQVRMRNLRWLIADFSDHTPTAKTITSVFVHCFISSCKTKFTSKYDINFLLSLVNLISLDIFFLFLSGISFPFSYYSTIVKDIRSVDSIEQISLRHGHGTPLTSSLTSSQ